MRRLTPSRERHRLMSYLGSPAEQRRAALSLQERPGLVKICWVELRKFNQTTIVVKRNMVVANGHKRFLAKMP